MQIQFNQVNQFNHASSFHVKGMYKSNTDSSLHSRRRMLESQEKADETEAVRVTISGEAMALARQAKAMERLEQFMDARAEKAKETEPSETEDESEETVQLTDEELYEELLAQVKMWGDDVAGYLHDYNHRETKEMAGERAAALTQLVKLEELQKSEISKLQKDAQKAAQMASMQQEEISRKNSELIMMLESFEEQDEEDDKVSESKDGRTDTEESDTSPAGSLMEGDIGASAARREMSMFYTMNMMDASSTHRIAASDHSIKGIEIDRKNIYRANDADNFTMKEKIDGMSRFVGTLLNDQIVRDLYDKRIEIAKEAGDKTGAKKLEAMENYFLGLEKGNQLHDLKEDREFALQERITARDLRIAHLGDRHFTMAEQQKKELQSLFDEDDIMRTQGQSSITSKMEDVAKRLQDKLDERDHIDEDTTPEEEIRDKEEQKNEELEKDTLEKEDKEDGAEQNPNRDDTESVHESGTFWKNAFDTMDWLNSVKKAKIMPDIAV